MGLTDFASSLQHATFAQSMTKARGGSCKNEISIQPKRTCEVFSICLFFSLSLSFSLSFSLSITIDTIIIISIEYSYLLDSSGNQ